MKKINEKLNSNEIEKVISKKNEKHALKEKSEIKDKKMKDSKPGFKEEPNVKEFKDKVSEVDFKEEPKLKESKNKSLVPDLKKEHELRKVEDKINLIINLSTDKNELIKLKRIILEFDEEKKLKEKEMIRDVERKIKRR